MNNLKLCVKYNVVLELSYSSNVVNSSLSSKSTVVLPKVENVFARHIRPIKNFDKYLWSPKICYANSDDVIDNVNASVFLLNYL